MINILEFVNESLRKCIYKDIPQGEVQVNKWNVFESEYKQFLYDYSDALAHLKANLPNSIGIKSFRLSKVNTIAPYYGSLRIELYNKNSSETPTTPTTSLTPVEVYEQNKNSARCVGCSKPTQPKAVLSSMINYCKSCSG